MSGAIAIIPARGGSKGLPGKNVRLICGKPLIAWTILAAKRSRYVDDVVVSTDSPQIAAVAEQWGATVVWRPDEISGDKASSESAVLHTLEALEAEGRSGELTVFLQCTAPLTTADDIDGTIDLLKQRNADTALTVCDFHYFLWSANGRDGAHGLNHEKSVRPLRQDREPQFIENGAVYVMKTNEFREIGHRFFGTTVGYLVEGGRTIEIDDEIDFQVAESLLAARLKAAESSSLPDKIDAIVLDFDGVLTGDTVYVNQDGSESVRCSRSDGMGIELAKSAGHRILILSKESNQVVSRRAEKLGIECIQSCDRKHETLDSWISEQGCRWENIVYVGNDVNDLECLRSAGCGVAVADARPEVIHAANLVLKRNGGNHAVRELVDLVLQRE